MDSCTKSIRSLWKKHILIYIYINIITYKQTLTITLIKLVKYPDIQLPSIHFLRFAIASHCQLKKQSQQQQPALVKEQKQSVKYFTNKENLPLPVIIVKKITKRR